MGEEKDNFIPPGFTDIFRKPTVKILSRINQQALFKSWRFWLVYPFLIFTLFYIFYSCLAILIASAPGAYAGLIVNLMPLLPVFFILIPVLTLNPIPNAYPADMRTSPLSSKIVLAGYERFIFIICILPCIFTGLFVIAVMFLEFSPARYPKLLYLLLCFTLHAVYTIIALFYRGVSGFSSCAQKGFVLILRILSNLFLGLFLYACVTVFYFFISLGAGRLLVYWFKVTDTFWLDLTVFLIIRTGIGRFEIRSRREDAYLSYNSMYSERIKPVD